MEHITTPSAPARGVPLTTKPRISVNKLAEYMEANALRRRQIVLQAKDPEPFITHRYSDARRALAAYIIGGYDENTLATAIAAIQAKPEGSDWQKDDRKNSITCLEIAQDADFPDLTGYDLSSLDVDRAIVELSGVDVSVLPDVLLRHRETGRVGGIKVHIAKTTGLSADGLKNVALVLRRYLIDRGDSEVMVDPDACFGIDVFSSSYEAAPKSYKRLMSRLEAACEEIRLRWEAN